MSRRPNRRLIIVVIGVLAVLCGSLSATERDNAPPEHPSTDPGMQMTAPSGLAPEPLSNVSFMHGQWQVEWIDHRSGSEKTQQGIADIRWINRGHALSEEFHADGETPQDSLFLLAYATSVGHFSLGEVDARSRSITLFDGHWAHDRLLLEAVQRTGGGSVRTHLRLHITPVEAGFDSRLESSSDHGMSWQTVLEKRYRPRQSKLDWFIRQPQTAQADAHWPQARQFDFLIGHWVNQNRIRVGPDQFAEFPAHSVASHALNGQAIREFSSYDVDPNNPEAATTIIRIFNPAMRQWENLYMTNRSNTLLHFNGRQEGEEMVLHNLGIDMRAANVPMYRFFDIEADRFSWQARSSTDQGASWQNNWDITATRSSAQNPSP